MLNVSCDSKDGIILFITLHYRQLYSPYILYVNIQLYSLA